MAIAGQQPVTIRADRLRLARLGDMLKPEAMLNAAGRAVSNEVRDNLAAMNAAEPNKLGGPRTHWYAQASRSVENRVNGDLFIISIPHVGFRLRLLGGTVKPGVNASRTGQGKTKYLTVPVIPEAYGKRAGEFEGRLQLRLRRIGGIVRAVGLEEKPDITMFAGMAKKNKGTVPERKLFFRFLLSATIRPEPRLLPTPARMADLASGAVEKLVRIMEDRANATGGNT